MTSPAPAICITRHLAAPALTVDLTVPGATWCSAEPTGARTTRLEECTCLACLRALVVAANAQVRAHLVFRASVGRAARRILASAEESGVQLLGRRSGLKEAVRILAEERVITRDSTPHNEPAGA